MNTPTNRQPSRSTGTKSVVGPNGQEPLVEADPAAADLDYLDPVDLASAMSFPASDPPAPYIPEPKPASKR